MRLDWEYFPWPSPPLIFILALFRSEHFTRFFLFSLLLSYSWDSGALIASTQYKNQSMKIEKYEVMVSSQCLAKLSCVSRSFAFISMWNAVDIDCPSIQLQRNVTSRYSILQFGPNAIFLWHPSVPVCWHAHAHRIMDYNGSYYSTCFYTFDPVLCSLTRCTSA